MAIRLSGDGYFYLDSEKSCHLTLERGTQSLVLYAVSSLPFLRFLVLQLWKIRPLMI
jgi:hypothetical protein